MNENDQSGKLAVREIKAARLWQMAPWVALFGVTLGPPAAFLIAYLLTGAATVYLVLALTSIPFALIAAIVTAVVLLFFRRRWAQQLRDHLASDGITADEVGYFLSELASGARRAQTGRRSAARRGRSTLADDRGCRQSRRELGRNQLHAPASE